MRFQAPNQHRQRPRNPGYSLGLSLRLTALIVGALAVMTAITRLGEPSTHRALARALGEPTTLAGSALYDGPPLVGPEVYEGVRDNAPFRSAEEPAWFATLAAVKALEPAALAAQSVSVAGYAALTSQPEAYRGRVVTIAGSVVRVEAVEPATNEAGVGKLWRVTLAPVGGEVWPLTVYTLEEPPWDEAPWNGEPYDATAVGVFFKKLSYRWAEGVGVTPVIVARRLETTIAANPAPPQRNEPVARQPDAEVAVPATGSMGRALLAELGFELAWFQAVIDKQRLLPAESDAFYGLLAVVERTPAPQLARLARAGLEDYAARRLATLGDSRRDLATRHAIQSEKERSCYSAVPLFGDGAAERGELVVFDAVVRRAVRVDASDSDAAKRLGVTHYFELEAFAADSQNLPLIFVTRDLPADFPVGDALRQPARLAGYFFKQWAYRSRYRTDAGDDRRQYAPLLVGRAPVLLAPPEPATTPATVIGFIGVALIAMTAAARWWTTRCDRRFEATTLSRFRTTSNAEALNFDRLGQFVDCADTAPPGP